MNTIPTIISLPNPNTRSRSSIVITRVAREFTNLTLEPSVQNKRPIEVIFITFKFLKKN